MISALELSQAYWRRYPDVAAHGYYGERGRAGLVGAWQHFEDLGRDEGRIWGLDAPQRLREGPLLMGAAPRAKEYVSKQECHFYHVVDLPDGTTTRGAWDLRNSADKYLGNVNFAGKTVIEIGPASGFLSFHMEGRGAQVAVIEPPIADAWDFVPQSTLDPADVRRETVEQIKYVRNSFWYLHDCFGSQVEKYELDAYRIPPQQARFDIGVLAAVLLHVSSPVRMLQSVAQSVAEQIIVVELYFPELAGPVCRLNPSVANGSDDTWWNFSPEFFQQYLAVLGFSHSTLSRHRQLHAASGREFDMFTVVAAR